MLFFLSADFFSKSFFLRKNIFRNAIRMSHSVDPDKARHKVGPDLGPNCWPRLLTDDTSRQFLNLKR